MGSSLAGGTVCASDKADIVPEALTKELEDEKEADDGYDEWVAEDEYDGYVCCRCSGSCCPGVRGELRLAPVASLLWYDCDAADAEADAVDICPVTSRGGAGRGLLRSESDRRGEGRCALGDGYGGMTGGSPEGSSEGYV